MSLATPQSLSTDTPTDVDTNLESFVLRFADSDHSEYSVAGLTAPNEKKLTVGHALGKGGEARHVVRIDRTEIDAVLVPATASVYINIIRPPSSALTNTIIKKMVYQLIDLLIEGGAGANIDAILNNEF